MLSVLFYLLALLICFGFSLIIYFQLLNIELI